MTHRGGDDSNFMRLLGRNWAVITSFVSSFMLRFIVSGPSRVEITVITFILIVIWVMVDGYARRGLRAWTLLDENNRWRNVIFEILDFLLMFSIFLAAQLVLDGLRSSINAGDLSTAEVAVFVLVSILIGSAIISTVKAFQQT